MSQVQSNLAWLGAMYGMYLGQHQGETPKTIDDLRKFVEKKTSKDQLTRLGAANINDLFVSRRDGKPFVMVSYNKPPTMGEQGLPPVVLYEAEGENGKKAVAFLGAGTRTVDESELQKLLPADAKPRR
ncbi:MAG: hypothetical protein WD851_10155 [Pirellulales bacterium]